MTVHTSPPTAHLPPSTVHLRTSSVAAGLLDAAVEFDDAPAIGMHGSVVTYRELINRAARIGTRLTAAAETADTPVLAQLSMSVDAVATVLGVFLARRPLVALDPDLPAERVAGIIGELTRHGRAPGLFVADDHHADNARAAAATFDLRVLPAADLTDDASGRPSVTRSVPPQDDPAAVTSIQFTSGSTGSPKGVLHPNAMWLADSLFLHECFGIVPARRILLCLPISFGAGLNVLINSLLNGAQIEVLDPRSGGTPAVLDAMAALPVHTAFMTPNLLRALTSSTVSHPAWTAVRRIITTGEPLTGTLAAAALDRAPAATITNWVGSSETSALAYFDVRQGDPVPAGNLPAGRVGPGKTVDIDADGAIVVTSPFLAGGYLDATMNDGRFGTDASGTPTFRMGDRGEWRDDTLHLGGRADNAIKVRGYLVEPTEVERALLSDGDLREVTVVPVTSPTDVVELAAYVVPDGSSRTPPAAVLRARMRHRLPDWMIPAHIVELSALPRTERGKIDRTALPRPHRVIDPPIGTSEQAIAELWAQILGLETVGRTENIYALGADSLTVQEILVAMTERLGITLRQAQVASAPTVAQVTELADAARTRQHSPGTPLAPTTVALRTAPGQPVFCFTGAGASALAFVPFADRIGRRPGVGSVYAFAPNGLENWGLPDWTVAAAARRHLRDLRRLQPYGPYVLVGHSLGGFIALEVARRLRAAGDIVEQVVVLDTFVPQRFAQSATADDPDMSLTPAEAPLPRAELWRRRLRIPFAGIVPMSPVDSARALEEVGRRVGIFHRPKPYAGPVLLVQGTENHDDPRIWRDRIAVGDLTVRRIDCDHMSIIRDPHIGDIVEDMVAAKMVPEHMVPEKIGSAPDAPSARREARGSTSG